ncbi:unnamed protein product [Natator depressus]
MGDAWGAAEIAARSVAQCSPEAGEGLVEAAGDIDPPVTAAQHHETISEPGPEQGEHGQGQHRGTELGEQRQGCQQALITRDVLYFFIAVQQDQELLRAEKSSKKYTLENVVL